MELARKLGLSARVTFTGYVPDEHLVILYHAATGLVLPSMNEGFGLPVVEAMACGCPVITSNVSSMPEVAGGAAELVEPTDAAGLGSAILKVVLDRAERDRLRAAGLKRAQAFTWQRTAEQTYAAYVRAFE